MSRTMSCGELKKAKFILTDNINIAGEEFENLSKSNAEGEGDVYQIKRGARILKINSREDLANLLNKKSNGKINLNDIKNLSSEEYKALLNEIKETYDGISINKNALHDLDPETRELLGGETGIKILNKEVLTNFTKGEDNTSYREGFKAKGTDLTKEMKDIAKEAYMNGGIISAEIAEFPMYRYSYDPDSNQTYFKGKDISDDIEKFESAAEKLNSKNLKLIDGVTSSIKLPDGKILISTGDCFKTKSLCEKALGKKIDHKDFIECMALYTDGAYKSDKDAYNKAIDKFRTTVLKGTENNDDGTINKPILYADKRDIFTDLSKEELHIEKMAWNYALSKAEDSQKEIIAEMAKIKLNSYQQAHLDNKLDDAVSYSIGDMEVRFFDNKTTEMINSATEPGNDSTDKTKVRVSISKTFKSAKESFKSIRKSTQEKVKNKLSSIGTNASQKLAPAREKIARVYNSTAQGFKDVYNDAKNLPKDIKKAYDYASSGVSTAYSNTKDNLSNSYTNAKTKVVTTADSAQIKFNNARNSIGKQARNIGNSAKQHVQKGASKAWKGIKSKVKTALIGTGNKFEKAGTNIDKAAANVAANLNDIGSKLKTKGMDINLN